MKRLFVAAVMVGLAAGGMAKKTEEHWVPKDPWHELAKDCEPSLGEKSMNGGCWVWIADVQPSPPTRRNP